MTRCQSLTSIAEAFSEATSSDIKELMALLTSEPLDYAAIGRRVIEMVVPAAD